MKIFQSTELSRHPISAMEAATKFYVDQQVTSGAIVGGLFFTNIAPTSSGIVGSKAYVSNTVPANAVITDGTTDTSNVTVTLYAEGGSAFFSPTVTITTVPAQAGGPIIASLSVPTPGDRVYTATANLTGITVDTTVTAVSSTNATATCVIHRAAAGPAVDVLLIGALPGSQTEVKNGDIVAVAGRVSNSATQVEVIIGGASGALSVMSTLGAPDSFGTGFRSFSGTFTVGSGTGAQTIQAQARNSLGTYGSPFTSTNSVVLNQTYPTIGARTITYPATQAGLKGSETASIAATVTNFDTISYTSADGSLSITAPTTYAGTKTVTRVGGSYEIGTQNYTITATKTSNAATSIASSPVAIANVAPTAAITTAPPGRMLSSPTGTSYTVTITASQALLSPPSLVASSGTWLGSWTGSGTTWSRALQILDTDAKGAQTFSSLSVTGLAGLVGTTITSGAAYTVGGFSTRTITFPAFAQYTAIGTTIVDITKVTAAYTGSTVLTRYADTGQHFQGFTIVDATGTYSPTGGYLFITDAAFAGANTTGTLQLDVTEAA